MNCTHARNSRGRAWLRIAPDLTLSPRPRTLIRGSPGAFLPPGVVVRPPVGFPQFDGVAGPSGPTSAAGEARAVDDQMVNRLRSPNFRSLINENILGKCFRSSWSSINPRISPLTTEYRCPRLSLLIITAVLETNKIGPHVLFYYSMLMYPSEGLL